MDKTIPVPPHLFAEKTRDSVGKNDIIEINDNMSYIILQIENDQNFPMKILLTSKKTMRKKNAEIIRQKFEDAGYLATIETSNTGNMSLKLDMPVSKKQKMDQPPAYN